MSGGVGHERPQGQKDEGASLISQMEVYLKGTSTGARKSGPGKAQTGDSPAWPLHKSLEPGRTVRSPPVWFPSPVPKGSASREGVADEPQ